MSARPIQEKCVLPAILINFINSDIEVSHLVNFIESNGTDLIWYFTDKFNQGKEGTYNPKKLDLCEKDHDYICRYRDSNDEVVYLSDMIIVDKDLLTNENSSFTLMKEFESSENVLVLIANTTLPLTGKENTTAHVHHLIDYN